jgi:hypothetical protein
VLHISKATKQLAPLLVVLLAIELAAQVVLYLVPEWVPQSEINNQLNVVKTYT